MDPETSELRSRLRANKMFYLFFIGGAICFGLGLLLEAQRFAFLSSGGLFLAAGVLALRRGQDIHVDHGEDGIELLPRLDDVSPSVRQERSLGVGLSLIAWGIVWLYIGFTKV